MSGTNPPVSSLDDRALLRAFLTDEERRPAAWTELLRRHLPLLLKTAWEFADDHDEAMAAYLFVCERLAADEFAKLRTYDPEHGDAPAKVSTWLAVVARNLCIEHRRQTKGRRRYPDAVADLSPLDQKVFELYFWEGASLREIVRRLGASPEYEADRVPTALERLRALDLRPSKTWARQPPRRFESFEEALHGEDHSAVDERADEDRREWVETLLEGLPPKERLAVRWYYWTGVSASGIGQLLEVSQSTVYALMDRALQKLRKRIEASALES
jgi:DNA-directed RNA polymerase specialized sigma24 family protein